ncbi:MAG: hypothetical protein AABX35_01555 [Nanoarchaeota archaeon]
MKTKDFKRLSTQENLDSLVERTLTCKPGHSIIRTSQGNIFRDVTVVNGDFREANWKKILSPKLISKVIPGLVDFTCPGIDEGAKVTEQHYMLTGVNAYDGKIFIADSDRQVWGMTNHPVNDRNFFDIPHNVVYHLPFDKPDIIAIGIDYAPTGKIAHGKGEAISGKFARVAMNYAVSRVMDYLSKVGSVKR